MASCESSPCNQTFASTHRTRLRQAGRQVLADQARLFHPPKRIASDIESIWNMQAKMTSGHAEDAVYVLGHARFKQR